MRVISEGHMQKEMGKVSNLITDMTIKGASQDEIAQAVRHSMVVIDSHKHELDYKRSRLENGIPNLEQKYQSGGGASTIVSRAKSPMYIPERRLRKASEGGPIDPDTGKKVYVPSDRKKYNYKTGELETRTKKYKSLEVVDDADLLVSEMRTPIERAYARHSNELKAMANKARLESLGIKDPKKNPSASKVYEKEVRKLKADLDIALRNAPLERKAQILANEVYRARKAANPDMDKKEAKKVKYQSLQEARDRMLAKKKYIDITDEEWEAIQAGALSATMLSQVINNAKPERVRELATPRTRPLMTASNVQRAKNMQNAGLTQAEIASALGVSLTTLKNSLNGD